MRIRKNKFCVLMIDNNIPFQESYQNGKQYIRDMIYSLQKSTCMKENKLLLKITNVLYQISPYMEHLIQKIISAYRTSIYNGIKKSLFYTNT